MIAKAALVLLLLAACPAAALAYPVPAPDQLEQLRRQHHRKAWLRVTTDSMRYEVRVRRIDDAGLGGFTTRRSAPAPPDPLPWSAIARIDRRTSGFRSGQITGVIFGALGGIIAANLTGLVENHGELGVTAGLTVGAVAGGWLGGRRGDRRVRERPFYAAPLQPAPASVTPDSSTSPVEAAPPDSLAAAPLAEISAPPSVGMTAPAAGPWPGGASPAVLSACRRLDPEDLLRVEADFGRFQGYAARVGPDGLEGLRADLGAPTPGPLPTMVTWDHIHHVDKRGNSAGAFARRGGMALGILGGIAGLATTGALGGSDTETVGGALAGAAIAGAAGAGIGGLIGLGIPRWHVVY